MFGALFFKLIGEGIPAYNPNDPSNYLTFVAAAILAAVVLGLALAAALRNPKMLRTGKNQ